MGFSTANNDFFKVADNEGRLVLVQGTDFLPQQESQHGLVDVAEADVVILDGPDAGTAFDGARFFQAALRSNVKRTIGKDPLLGRIGKGPKKAGKSEPWIFLAPTAEDIALAEKYQAENSSAADTSDAPFQIS